MANQPPANFTIKLGASKMPDDIMRVDEPTPQLPFIEPHPSTTDPTSDMYTSIDDNEEAPQETIHELCGSAPIPASKRKRRSKEDHNQLKAQIIRLSEAGYEVLSLQVLLGVRKDRILNCLTEILSERGGFQEFSQHKQILPQKSLRGLNWSKQSDYWEAARMPNGDIHLTAVDLATLRKRFGIDN